MATIAKTVIRWMIRSDMDDILEIEQLSFSQPWIREEFLHVLRKRNAIGMVTEVRDERVGFMVYELFKGRIELLDLAVHPSCRRNGIGAAMIEKLIYKLETQKRTEITLHIRDSNLEGQLFFQAMGRVYFNAGL